MSEETDPKPEGELEGSGAQSSESSRPADESAAAAKDAAKEFANNAGEMFHGLNQKMQIYLVALAVALVCSLFFSAYKIKSKLSKDAKAVLEMSEGFTGIKTKTVTSIKTNPIAGLGGLGAVLALLGMLGGIGILVWSTIAKRKDSWIPLALAGAAGAVVLGILMTRIGTGGYWTFGGGINVNGTLLGWWLPLAAAVTATVVSVQRILEA